MTELRLNGNFLNWFWRGAQTELAWRDIEMERGRGFLPRSPCFTLSLDMFQPSTPLAFILYLSFIATHLSFCFNLSYLTSTSHLHLHNLFTYLYDGIILWTIISFYSSLIYMQDPKLQVPVVFEVNWSLNSLDWECKPNLNEHEWISVRKWKLTSHG